MKLTWEELSSLNSPSFYLVKSRTRDVDLFSNKFPKELKITSKLIRGQNCKNTKELFREFSSALQFPYYFGNNWNALDECICDLSWLGENNGYVLFITNSDLLSENLDILLETLSDASKFWEEKSKIFKIVFHTEEEVDLKIINISEERTLEKFDNIK